MNLFQSIQYYLYKLSEKRLPGKRLSRKVIVRETSCRRNNRRVRAHRRPRNVLSGKVIVREKDLSGNRLSGKVIVRETSVTPEISRFFFIFPILDHTRRAFSGLYHCAKFGWNRCSSFDNMRCFGLANLAWKCLFT